MTGMILTGCDQKKLHPEVSDETIRVEQKTKDPPKKVRHIGISYITSKNMFFYTIADKAREIFEQKGFVVTMANADNSPENQENQVRDFIEQPVDAILLIPCHSLSIGQAVRLANREKIPVFTADVAVLDPGAQVVCHVATDNYGGGKIAGHQILDAVSRKGKVAVIDYPDIESVEQRLKGFREVIDYANHEGAEIELADVVPAFGDRNTSKEKTLELLDQHPDITAIFAVNDPTAFGTIDALKELEKLEQVRVISFDGTVDAMQMVRDGTIYADIIQFPEEIATHVAKEMMRYLEGEPVPSRILIPTAAYVHSQVTDTMMTDP